MPLAVVQDSQKFSFVATDPYLSCIRTVDPWLLFDPKWLSTSVLFFRASIQVKTPFMLRCWCCCWHACKYVKNSILELSLLRGVQLNHLQLAALYRNNFKDVKRFLQEQALQRGAAYKVNGVEADSLALLSPSHMSGICHHCLSWSSSPALSQQLQELLTFHPCLHSGCDLHSVSWAISDRRDHPQTSRWWLDRSWILCLICSAR